MLTEKKPIVILLAGQSGAGKTTIGEYMETHHGWYEFAFADELKVLTSIKETIPLYFFYHNKEDKVNGDDGDLTYRQLLINNAGEIRKKDNEIFVRGVWKDIQTQFKLNMDKKTPFIITDCRFQVEIDYLKKRSHCITVWVDTNKKNTVFDDRQLKKSAMDVCIDNTSDGFQRKDIKKQLQQIVKKINVV